ncbi:MAG: peptidylprolyl isomerase [Tepidisphaeraceae bacterium]|jgi:cyclophilin family peptidyl-prolyl cis-trans isomerase
MTPSAAVSLFSILFSVLVPQKIWYAPSQPLNVTIQSDKDVTLELTDFMGRVIAAKGSAEVVAKATVDLKTLFPDTASPGTYVLYAAAKGSGFSPAGPPKDFLGTPLVIEVLANKDQDAASTMITHVVPLQYVTMQTDSGPLTEVFYYDAAPHTVDGFLQLASGGYYDGLVFHRIIPGFVIQGGDPLGSEPARAGTGGPGYMVGAEFNDHPHVEGVLSMARANDPNSAGSQFFICLDYAHTQQLDHKYTAFGRVVAGMDAVKKIASVKTDPSNDRPEHPPVITKVDVLPVTAKDDPYKQIMGQ